MKVLKQYIINVEANTEFCNGCALGKEHGQSFGTRASRPSSFEGQINADVCGPMKWTSISGARHYVCFKHDYSKHCVAFFMTTKSKEAQCLPQFLKEVKHVGHDTKVPLLDGGKKFNC